MVQVGTVGAARQAVKDGADVVVAQGVDAGGHQFASGAGVISLVPEVRTMLDTEFPDRDVALVAAGGIVDGRGVAAALTLGKQTWTYCDAVNGNEDGGHLARSHRITGD